MRIFLSCLQALRPHRIPPYSFWEIYFKRGIEEAGHQWIEAADLDWAEGLTLSDKAALSRWREQTWSLTLEYLRRELQNGAIDLFLGYLYPQMIEPSAIAEIQRLGVPCVSFFCDNIREFRKVPSEYYRFDLNWVPEYGALKMYAAAGLKYVHAPMPCWIPPQRRTAEHTENYGPTFVGSCDHLRRNLLGNTVDLGAPLTIRGPGWQPEASATPMSITRRKSAMQLLRNQYMHISRHGVKSWWFKFEPFLRPLRIPDIPGRFLAPKVFGDSYVAVTQESVVTVGINRVQTFRHSIHNPITYSRLRDVEAPMMGACYLTEWAEDLEHLYTLGVDIETYRTSEELAAKIKELLADPARRLSMRRAGQRRALNELSVPRSLNKITAALGIH
jgi:hypothetical protein